jgi:hypothetical protein
MHSESELLTALDILTLGGGESGTALTAETLAARTEHQEWVNGSVIQGFGIGEKVTDGEILDEVVLKVYVDQKIPEQELPSGAKIPKQVYVPGIDGAIQTDVEAIGVVHLESNTTRVRPAIPGFSIGHTAVTAGTFGCLVQKGSDDSLFYILSNSHVLADEGLASKGDSIIQPGKADGGTTPTDLLGALEDFVPFDFSPGYPNRVDAAIAKVNDKTQVTSAIRIIGVPVGTSLVLSRGMQVQKCGRTTDYTIGIIRDINYRTTLNYKRVGGGTSPAGFQDQVLCTRYTDSGDSGSAVLNMQKELLGLHFAGSDSSSIFNKIGNVFTALKIAPVLKLV